jgi:hypothetical protein
MMILGLICNFQCVCVSLSSTRLIVYQFGICSQKWKTSLIFPTKISAFSYVWALQTSWPELPKNLI